jgi:peroxiredoxin Q/BCP
MSEILTAGKQIPEFNSQDQDGKAISSRDLSGKPSVIYFYPRDNTPGCTVEACEFRDSMEDFTKLGVGVFGVSTDSGKSHKNFTDKFNLNFPLIVDQDKKISQSFGVLNGNSASRVTFIADHNGKIVHVFEKVSPRGHSAEVKGKLKELGLIH